jgi:hypothetical protein
MPRKVNSKIIEGNHTHKNSDFITVKPRSVKKRLTPIGETAIDRKSKKYAFF